MNFQTINAAASPEVQMNENFETIDFASVYGKRQPVTTGLTWGYYGGRWGGASVAQGTFTLTDSSTNYIVVARATGVTTCSTSATNWNDTANYGRVYKLTTSGGLVTAIEDHRNGTNGIFGQPNAFTTIQAATGMAVGGATPGAGGLAFPATAVAVADPNTLDDYEEYTAASTACTGAITTACVWKLTKIGNKVTLTLPAVQGAGVATTNFTVGLTIPAEFRPAADFASVSAPIINNAAKQSAPGMIKVTSAGVISVWLNGTESGNFTVTANAGLAYTTSVSWTI